MCREVEVDGRGEYNVADKGPRQTGGGCCARPIGSTQSPRQTGGGN